jgi:hypothetical protein
MKVINLFGGPCSGKSTTAAGIFYFMKMRGYKVELVTEYAKELAYDGMLNMMLDRQEVIFAEQNQRVHRLRWANIDYVILDSPLLLSYIYPEMNQMQKGVTHWPALCAFQQLVLAVIDTYDNRNFFLQRPDTFEQHGREHNLAESKTIDSAILTTLEDKGYDYDVLPTDEYTVNRIIDIITKS